MGDEEIWPTWHDCLAGSCAGLVCPWAPESCVLFSPGNGMRPGRNIKLPPGLFLLRGASCCSSTLMLLSMNFVFYVYDKQHRQPGALLKAGWSTWPKLKKGVLWDQTRFHGCPWVPTQIQKSGCVVVELKATENGNWLGPMCLYEQSHRSFIINWQFMLSRQTPANRNI